MKLEFRVPISPKPAFYAQVRLIAQSLARLGGEYARARIQVCVGEQPALAELREGNRWSESFPVDWFVVPDEVYARVPAPPWASGHARYFRSSDADVVVLCDADICPVADFDELLLHLQDASPAVAGLQAHYAPFKTDNDATWRGLLEAAGAPLAPMQRAYSMDVQGLQGTAPAYFNYGFVAFNAAAFRAVAADIDHCLALACEGLPQNPFAAQVALALAVARGGINVLDLGHEHNCANDDLLVAHELVHPGDVRVIHYLRGDDLARHRFLCDRDLFEAFLARERANPINERLRQHLLGLPDACATGAFT